MAPTPGGRAVSASQLACLLDHSLRRWGVSGSARADADGFPVHVHLSDGARYAVLPAGAQEQPIRWWMLWLALDPDPRVGAVADRPARLREAAGGSAGDGRRAGCVPATVASFGADRPGAGSGGARCIEAALSASVVRRKPCSSVSGLLRTMRETLGVPGCSRARVGASPG
jgi:hypothetical protein